VTEFCAVDEALTFAIKRLERFEELGQSPRIVVWICLNCFEDWQNLFELVRLFSCE